MKHHSLTNLFKKVIVTGIFATALVVMFTGCPSPSSGGGEEEVTQGATITITEFPDGIEGVIIVSTTSDQYSWTEYASISKSDLPYNKTFTSEETMNGVYLKKDFSCKIIVRYTGDYGTLQGEQPLKVLLNGTALEEIKQEYKTPDDQFVTNLVQYNNGFVASVKLDDNNAITFTKGNFRKIKPNEIKLADNTTYAYVDMSELKCNGYLQYELAGNNATLFQCAINGLYCCLPDYTTKFIATPTNGNKIKPDSFKVNNTSMGTLIHKDGYEGFEGEFTSGAVGEVSVITGEEEGIEDLFQIAGKTISSAYYVRDGVMNKAIDVVKIIADETFVSGKENDAKFKADLVPQINAKYYYKTQNNEDYYIIVEYNNNSGISGQYTVEKLGDTWIISSHASNPVTYYSGKAIRLSDISENNSGFLLEEKVIFKPEFIGFDEIPTDLKYYVKNGSRTETGKLQKYTDPDNPDYYKDYYYFTVNESWNLNPSGKQTYWISAKVGDETITSNESFFKIQTIILSLPDEYKTVQLGNYIKLPVEFVNYNGTLPTSVSVRLYDGNEKYKTINEGGISIYPVVDAEIKDGICIIPTSTLFSVKTTLWICTSNNNDNHYSNMVEVTLTKPNSTITISHMENAAVLDKDWAESPLVSRPVCGEKETNLFPITFSNNFAPEESTVICTLKVSGNDNAEAKTFEAPVVNGKIQFVFSEFDFPVLDDNQATCDLSVTTCQLEPSNTIKIRPWYKDDFTITIPSDPITLALGDNLEIPVTVSKEGTQNLWINSLCFYAYSNADDAEPIGSTDLLPFMNGKLIMPTYDADVSELYFAVGSREYDDFDWKPVISTNRFKLTITDRSGTNTIALSASNSKDGTFSGTLTDYNDTAVLFKVTPSFAEPGPDEVKYCVYAQEEGKTYKHRYYSEYDKTNIPLDDDNCCAVELLRSSSYFFMGTQEDWNFKIQGGKTYKFWVETCGIKSNEVTITMSDSFTNN